ncbi:MAG: thioredoxin [Nitriliruptorales bacterium]
MATVALTKESFDQVLEDNDLVLVDFWAEWCGPCRSFAPIYARVSDEHDDIVFGKVDTDAQVDLASSFGIRSIPTLTIFRDGVVLYHQPGVVPAEGLQDLIGQVRGLDMDDVRRQIAEHEAAHNHS